MQTRGFDGNLIGAVAGQGLGDAIGNGNNGGATLGGLAGVLMVQLEGTLAPHLSRSAAGRRNMLAPRLGTMSLLPLAAGFAGGVTTDLSTIGLQNLVEDGCREQFSGR